jgi:hypothetical protein
MRRWLVGWALLAACGRSPNGGAHPNPDAGPFVPEDAGPPDLMVLDPEVDLGSADIGQSIRRDFRIENFGTDDWTIVAGTGDSGNDFSVAQTTVYGGTIAGVTISFLPYSSGVHTATMTLTVGEWSGSVHVKGDTYTKLAIAPSLGGTVVAPDQDISCSQAAGGCSTRFSGDVVLQVIPDRGNTFVAWSDPSCGSQPTCTLHPEAAGRAINAYFATTAPQVLDLTITGDGNDSVRITNDVNDEIASCRTSCSVPLANTSTVGIEARGPTTVAAIAGACSGATQCSFPVTGSTNATVTFPHDARVAWTRTLENPTATSGRYDSSGNLIVVSCAFEGGDSKVIKLDPAGHTIWSHPGYEGTEISIGPNDEIYIRSSEQHNLWILGSDGYLLGAGDLGAVEPFAYFGDPYFFQHRLVTTSDMFASVGPLNGTTLFIYGAQHNATSTIASSSLEQIARTPTQLFASVANASGGADLATFALDGTPQAAIPNIAPNQGSVKFGVMSNGDVISASSSDSQISLRRVSNGVTTVSVDHPIPANSGFLHPPHTMALEVAGDRVFWYSQAVGGFDAEVVNASGTVEWTTSRGVDGAELDVYDAVGSGNGLTLIGGYRSISPVNIAVPGLNVDFAEGFVQHWLP